MNKNRFDKDEFIAKMLNVDECVFCAKIESKFKIEFGPLLNKALYERYSPGAEQEQLKLINDLLDNQQSQWAIKFKDIVVFEEDEEYLKTFYSEKPGRRKMKQLLEYYKYHYDVPRIYIEQIDAITEDFHNKYKEIKYNQIKHLLGIAEPEIQENINVKESFKVLEGISNTEETSRVILNQLIENLGENEKIKCVNFSESWFSMTRTSSYEKGHNKKLQTTSGTVQVPDLMKQVEKYIENYKSSKLNILKTNKNPLQKMLVQDIVIPSTPKIIGSNARSFQEKIINSKPQSFFQKSTQIKNNNLKPNQSSKPTVGQSPPSPSITNLIQYQHIFTNQINLRRGGGGGGNKILQTSSTHRKLNTQLSDASLSPKCMQNKKKTTSKRNIRSQISQDNALDFYRQWQQQQIMSQRALKQFSLQQIQIPKTFHISDVSKRVVTEVPKINPMKLTQKKLLESIYQGNYYKPGFIQDKHQKKRV